MNADISALVERLRNRQDYRHNGIGWKHEDDAMSQEAATALVALETERVRMEGALQWYSENARLCRLLHSEGDAGRNALQHDGGKRARAALTPDATPHKDRG